MARRKLSFASIADIDGGRIVEAVDQGIALLIRDLEDRPNNDAARTLKLSIKLKPEASEAGDLDGVDVSFDISESIPKRSSRQYHMRPLGDELWFNSEAPENADQKTIDDFVGEAVDAG